LAQFVANEPRRGPGPTSTVDGSWLKRADVGVDPRRASRGCAPEGMVLPIRPGQSRHREAPCRICGSSVEVHLVEGRRRLGATTAPMIEVDLCTNPECRSNGTNANRGVGDAP